jgi:transcriptional regulator with XRE-family HTH domain
MAKLTAKKVGRQVEALRKRLGLSRPDFAARLHIDRTHVWRIERGDTLPSLRLLDLMSREFSVSLDDLRGGEAR